MTVLGIAVLGAALGDRQVSIADIAPGSPQPAKPRQKKHNLVWSNKDESILKKMLADGESVEEVAVKLKRTRQAISARASRLHLTFSNAKKLRGKF